MNVCLLAAAGLASLVGVVHSVLGEVLIFRHLRRDGWVPNDGGSRLGERHVRILWATWHLASVFGFALAAILVLLADPQYAGEHLAQITTVAALAFAAGSLLVLVGTRGRHPGWIGLLGVALLILWH